MEIETEHHKTLSVNDNDSLVPEPSSTKESLLEPSSAGLVLTKVELDFAFVAEKLLNLSLLIIQLCSKEHDLDSFVSHKEEAPSSNDANDSAEKALEFDLLSSILNSEVKEVESLLNFIQNEIQNAHETSGDLSAKINTQNADQQRKFLRMLEKKSLAKEMELEKKLNESRNAEYELGMKLYSSSQDAAVYMEEVIEDRYSKWLEAENASKVFKGMSTEMSGKLQILHFNLSSSLQREENFEKIERHVFEGRYAIHGKDENESLIKFTCMELGLQNCKDVYESLDNFIEGVDKYTGEKTGSSFKDLPSVLQFKLARFKSDANKNRTVKQRNVLRMLKKSLAKEMELEKKLSESRNTEYELGMKLYSSSQDAVYMEEEIEDAYSKWLMSRPKEIGSFKWEENLKSEIEGKECALHKLDSSNAKVSDFEHITEDLKDRLAKTEARAEEAESRCQKLEESQKELQDELENFKGKGFTLEKLASLGKHLRDSDLQLEHAAAAVEASKEKQNLLYSTVSDMENVIKDLKSKVLKAENRAYCSEEKLIMVSESNKDLNEELRFCRGKLKEGERYIHQAEERKLRTTKDIALHNKIKKKTGNAIANLSRENRVLMVKLKKIGKTGYMESEVSPKSDQSSHKLQATITPLTNQEEEETESKPDVRSVRRVDAGTLRLKQSPTQQKIRKKIKDVDESSSEAEEINLSLVITRKKYLQEGKYIEGNDEI
ncbi:hypothetical protein Bca101_024286 [Brassica carinata]